jgi:hypothetical protein
MKKPHVVLGPRQCAAFACYRIDNGKIGQPNGVENVKMGLTRPVVVC